MKGNAKLIETLNALLSDELTAINQYMVHSEMCANWGYEKLHKHFEKRAIDEMKHAEKLIGRILFLEGIPTVSKLGKISIGADVPNSSPGTTRSRWRPSRPTTRRSSRPETSATSPPGRSWSTSSRTRTRTSTDRGAAGPDRAHDAPHLPHHPGRIEGSSAVEPTPCRGAGSFVQVDLATIRCTFFARRGEGAFFPVRPPPLRRVCGESPGQSFLAPEREDTADRDKIYH